MVGPVLLIDGHLVLLDDQHVQVAGAVHGVVQVEEPVLVPAGRRGECRTLYDLPTLQSRDARCDGQRAAAAPCLGLLQFGLLCIPGCRLTLPSLEMQF